MTNSANPPEVYHVSVEKNLGSVSEYHSDLWWQNHTFLKCIYYTLLLILHIKSTVHIFFKAAETNCHCSLTSPVFTMKTCRKIIPPCVWSLLTPWVHLWWGLAHTSNIMSMLIDLNWGLSFFLYMSNLLPSSSNDFCAMDKSSDGLSIPSIVRNGS